MPEKSPRLYLAHIREAIGLIEQYIRGRQRSDLDRHPMLRQATWRSSRRLRGGVPEALKARHPTVPWRDIAAIGNILRHECPAVNRDIWRVATEHVPLLATAVDSLLAEVLRDPKK